MSRTAQPSGKDANQSRSKNVRILIALSFLISGSILIVSLTMPFRQPGSPLVSTQPEATAQSAAALDLADQIRIRRDNAAQFRHAAEKLDEEFIKTFVKGKPRPSLPGLEQTKSDWQRRATFVRSQQEQLKEVDQRSLEWQHHQEMAEALRDAPR